MDEQEIIRKQTELALDAVERLFPSKGLMHKTVAHESHMGQHPNTFREGYYGGVAQVDPIGFEDTQDIKAHPGLRRKYDMIRQHFDIDWPSVQYEELVDPLKSIIAGRLRYMNVPAAVPDDDLGQAKYWKRHYNTEAGKGTPEKFLKSLNKLKG